MKNSTAKPRKKTSACKSIRNVWRYCRCTTKSGWLFTKFLMFLPFLTTRPLKYDGRLTNGLYHSRCPGFHANEKNNYFETSIIWIRRLQRQEKLLFKICCTFDKDQTTRFIITWCWKHFWFNCLFTRVYMICLIFPSASQLTLIG